MSVADLLSSTTWATSPTQARLRRSRTVNDINKETSLEPFFAARGRGDATPAKVDEDHQEGRRQTAPAEQASFSSADMITRARSRRASSISASDPSFVDPAEEEDQQLSAAAAATSRQRSGTGGQGSRAPLFRSLEVPLSPAATRAQLAGGPASPSTTGTTAAAATTPSSYATPTRGPAPLPLLGPSPVGAAASAESAWAERERRARELSRANAHFRHKFGLREENLVTCTYLFIYLFI